MQFPIHGEAAEPSILLEEIGASRYNKTTDLECRTVSIGVEDGVPDVPHTQKAVHRGQRSIRTRQFQAQIDRSRELQFHFDQLRQNIWELSIVSETVSAEAGTGLTMNNSPAVALLNDTGIGVSTPNHGGGAYDKPPPQSEPAPIRAGQRENPTKPGQKEITSR